MSSPIDIPRRVDSSSTSLGSTSPRLYIPIHKRTASSASSPTSSLSSSQELHKDTTLQSARVYSAEFLMTLRPNAIESMKERVHASCPEIVMTHRVRKNLHYSKEKWRHAPRSSLTTPTSATAAAATTTTTTKMMAPSKESGMWRRMNVPVPAPLRLTLA